MKKHNTLKVVLITMLVFFLLSWILPAAVFQSEYVEQGRTQMGLFDIFNYPLTSLSYFGYIALYLVAVGGFYGILYKIPAYRILLDKIVKMSKRRESIILSLMVIIIAVAVSVCGLKIAFALFVPFIVSIILLMGYDKIVAALVTVGSMVVGIIGCTYSVETTNMLTSGLNIAWDFEILVRFIILLVGIILVIFNVILYIKKNSTNVKIEKKTVKKVEIEAEAKENEVVAKKTSTATKKKSTSTSKSKSTASKSKTKTTTKSKSSKSRKSDNKAALKDEDIIVVKDMEMDNNYLVPKVVESMHSVWPLVVGFIILFVLMVLAFISWGEGAFGIKVFQDCTDAVTKFELFGFPIFAKILGTFQSFGSWTITDMFLPMFIVVVLLSIIYHLSFDDVIDGFVAGAKKALAPAVMVILLYTILVLVTYHPFQLVIYKAVLGLSKGFNVATTTLVAILASLFNSDASYTFQSVIPYYTSVVTNSAHYKIVGIIFQSMYGLTMLIAPTSLILMGTLAYLNVSYKNWFKAVWKLLLELFIILLIIFIFLALL